MPCIRLFDFAEMKKPLVSGGFSADIDADVNIEVLGRSCVSVLWALLFLFKFRAGCVSKRSIILISDLSSELAVEMSSKRLRCLQS